MSVDARRSREAWVDPRTWRIDARFGRGSVTGSVLRAGAQRIEAVFSPSPALPPVGRVGQVTISSPELDQPVKTAAVTRDRVDVAKDLIMFGFELRRGEDHDDELFATRRAVRIPFPGAQPVHGTIRCGAGTATGRVRDISVTGVSIACPSSAELMLHIATSVQVMFTGLSIGDAPIPAKIQHRRFDSEGLVVYGIGFEATGLRRLERLVAELQHAQARAR